MPGDRHSGSPLVLVAEYASDQGAITRAIARVIAPASNPCGQGVERAIAGHTAVYVTPDTAQSALTLVTVGGSLGPKVEALAYAEMAGLTKDG